MKLINQILSSESHQVNFIPSIEDLSRRKDYILNIAAGELYHKRPNYNFKLRPGGFIPKSGIHLADYFLSMRGKWKINLALEIGVGEIAFLPITLVKNNLAKKVVGVEINPTAIAWSKNNIAINNLQNKITLYDNLNALDSKQFDLIFSNPPQMPVQQDKSLHDDGGKDGYQVIDQVINYSREHLNNQGRLVLLMFDFLNVAESYNNDRPPLIDILQEQGYEVNIKKSIFKTVRPGGKTEQNLDWIKKRYPFYEFKHGDKAVGYNLLIIEATKK